MLSYLDFTKVPNNCQVKKYSVLWSDYIIAGKKITQYHFKCSGVYLTL